MKIEIVPEGNKTKREKGESHSVAWIFDAVFGGIRSFVDTVLDGVAESVEDVMNRVARKAFVSILFVLGLWFLLSGFAKLLNVLYGVAGLGDLVVGMFVFAVAFIFSVLWKK